jgi:predicted metalloprotease with PDZ domain
VLLHDRLQALDVRMTFDAPAAGVVRVKPPQGIGQQAPSRKVTVTGVHSAKLTTLPDGDWSVRAKAGAHVQIDYRIAPAASSLSVASSGYTDVLMGADWFQGLGENLFAHPDEDTSTTVRFQWHGPATWRLVTPLDDLAKAAPLTLQNLLQTTILGGTHLQTASRPIRGGMLHIAGGGAWPLPLERYADQAAAVVSAQRAFWNDSTGPYTVTVVAMDRDDAFNAGVGRDGAFAAYVARRIAPANFRALVTHEYTHMWIPRRTGRMPDGTDEPSAYWYSEGFTVFHTSRAMLRSGGWALQDFVNDFNALTTGYAMSPARHIANHEVVRGFWKNADVQNVPYQRGAMLAWMLDERLRARTHGRRTMDDVLLRMRDRFSADQSLEARANLLRSYADEGGGAIDDWLSRFIDRGEQMILPANIFDGCLTVLEENKFGIGRVQSVIADRKLSPEALKGCVRRIGG